MLMGNAKGIEGPYTKGTYLWVEVENLNVWRIAGMRSLYPHCVGIHKKWSRCSMRHARYIGVKPDHMTRSRKR